MEYEWRNVGSLCEHCGQPIEQRPANTQGLFIVSGFEPMEYRHSHDKERICVRVLKDKVKPYDECRQYEKYHRHENGRLTCPSCGSSCISLTWITPQSFPEHEVGHCGECGEVWNQCIREANNTNNGGTPVK